MIRVENLWKSFPVTRDKPGFKEFILKAPRFLGGKREVSWVLKDISFEVREGECLGIIGRNGAGKSTLLALLLGIMNPTKGTVDIQGRKTPLLELGAGFNPEMTGRENAMLNGVLLGLTEKEVLRKMDDIIEFAELGEYIDMPARIYSSGMYMRLAFSIAIHTRPNVLLLDEILSVGDESFTKKSNKALKDLVGGGATTVFVSHNMDAIRSLCNRVIWLDCGAIKAIGDTEKVVNDYLSES